MEPKAQIYEASERKAGTEAKRNSGRISRSERVIFVFGGISGAKEKRVNAIYFIS